MFNYNNTEVMSLNTLQTRVVLFASRDGSRKFQVYEVTCVPCVWDGDIDYENIYHEGVDYPKGVDPYEFFEGNTYDDYNEEH